MLERPSSGKPLAPVACGAVIALALILASGPANGQSAPVVFPIPTELSVGLGGVVEGGPGRGSPAIDFALAWIYVRDQWIEPLLAVGLGGYSDVARCQEQDGLVAPADTCFDGYFVGGLRVRPLRESDRVQRPFVHVAAGGYWRGGGEKDKEFLPADFALQVGGGIDFRRSTSIHGVRLSSDYRHVFGEPDRSQFQFVVSYFVGWRGAPKDPNSGGTAPVRSRR